MEGVGGCPKFIVLSTGPLSVPNYYTIITQGLYWEVRTVRMHLLLHIRPFTSYFYLFFFTFTVIPLLLILCKPGASMELDLRPPRPEKLQMF